MTTFAMAANAICFTKPDYYVLENVEGCRFLDCICVRLLRFSKYLYVDLSQCQDAPNWCQEGRGRA